jgi:golgi-specific brefeldin A-resistance guanine nucleotide exchange factor 1
MCFSGDIETGQPDESMMALVEQSPAFVFRNGRQKVSKTIPSHEQLMAIKCRKKLLATGSEHFNAKATKGIEFLQDNHLLSVPLEPTEVVVFLKENPKLDKKMIGEYISTRKNLKVLEAFVR